MGPQHCIAGIRIQADPDLNLDLGHYSFLANFLGVI